MRACVFIYVSCVCVRVCVRARARVCECMRMCVSCDVSPSWCGASLLRPCPVYFLRPRYSTISCNLSFSSSSSSAWMQLAKYSVLKQSCLQRGQRSRKTYRLVHWWIPSNYRSLVTERDAFWPVRHCAFRWICNKNKYFCKKITYYSIKKVVILIQIQISHIFIYKFWKQQ